MGMGNLEFLLMVTCTILIAAAGYTINDYFDIETDLINKPQKLYIRYNITSGTVLAYAIILSLIALTFSIWLSVNLKSWVAGGLLCSALIVVWWYAFLLKKSLLWGNLAVSCMTAGIIAMAWIIENDSTKIPTEVSQLITKIVIAVCVFAFLLSLLREIIKDTEDIEGDRLIQCRSLPIVKGITFTKYMTYSISILVVILIMVAQYNLLEFSKPITVIWLACFVQIPIIIFILMVIKAKTKNDYHLLSRMLKWIMLGGLSTLIAGQF